MSLAPVRGLALPFTIYAALAVASTWPLALEASRAFPLGTEHAVTVPFASGWALWWTSDRAAHGFADYWHAPIFYPTAESFAFSEPMPALGLLATPLLWLGLPLCLAYNLVLLLCLTLNGSTSHALLRELGLGQIAAGFGGAFVLLLPSVHHELGVLTLVPLFGVVLTLLALARLTQRPSVAGGVKLGLSLALTFMMCAQYAVFLGWGLALSAPWWGRSLWTAAGARALATALAVLVLSAGPVAWSQHHAIAPHHFVRSAERAREGASQLSEWLRPPWPELVPTPFLDASASAQQKLYPGTVRVALALLALVALWRRRGQRGLWPALGVLAFADVVLATLPNLGAGPFEPFEWVRRVVPGLDMIRTLWRSAIVTQLVLALFAALGVEVLGQLAGRLERKQKLGVAGVVLLSSLASIELWPPAQALRPAPSELAYAPFASWVRDHVPPEQPLAYLPLPKKRVGTYADTARFMLLTRGHGRPMVNGYSSFFPAPYERLLDRGLGLLSPTTPGLLREYGVRHVVVTGTKQERLEEQARSAGYRLEQRFDELGLAIFEVPVASSIASSAAVAR